MTTQAHQPWKPTCWVGGQYIGQGYEWMEWRDIPLSSLTDGSRKKYAATKATAAIIRSMRK